MRLFVVLALLLPGCLIARGDLRGAPERDAFGPDSAADAGRLRDAPGYVDGFSEDALSRDAFSNDAFSNDVFSRDAFSNDAFVAPDAFDCAAVTERCNARDDNCNGSVDEGACGGCDASMFGGSVYLVCRGTQDWDGARAACMAFGAGYDLTVLTSPEEITFAQGAARVEVWVGLSDDGARISGASEDDFRWLDGTPGTVAADGGLLENCVVLRRSGALLGDRVCTNTYAFMCEARVR